MDNKDKTVEDLIRIAQDQIKLIAETAYLLGQKDQLAKDLLSATATLKQVKDKYD